MVLNFGGGKWDTHNHSPPFVWEIEVGIGEGEEKIKKD